MTKFGLQDLNRTLLGFDKLFQEAEARISNLNSYPPHNIIKLSDSRYLLEFAVAGFKRADLSIEIANGTLTIRGTKEDGPQCDYIYQGLAKRSFVKQIALSDYMEVTNAYLENGILVVQVERRLPEAMRPKQIEIN